MSDYRFGSGDYGLNIYPAEAFDGMGGFDIDKVERVEIDWVDFVRERTTTRNAKFKTKYGRKVPLCECCGYSIGDQRYNFCPKCGARIVEGER